MFWDDINLHAIIEDRMRGKPTKGRRIQMLHDLANDDGYTVCYTVTSSIVSGSGGQTMMDIQRKDVKNLLYSRRPKCTKWTGTSDVDLKCTHVGLVGNQWHTQLHACVKATNVITVGTGSMLMLTQWRWVRFSPLGLWTLEPFQLQFGVFDYISHSTAHTKYGGRHKGAWVRRWVKLYLWTLHV